MRVLYNQGDQRISVVPVHPETGGPVVVDVGTDVTLSIFDGREHELSANRTVLAVTTVTQDAFSESLTGAAGFAQASPQSVPVDASAAAIGRTYLLVDSIGRAEPVQLTSVGGTATADVAIPLRGSYSAADTLVGVELVGTFPSAEANDEGSVEDSGGPYFAVWTYVVDGKTVTLPTELWVDRFSMAPPVDEAYVLRAMPTLAQRSRGRGTPREAISVAWDDWLAMVQSAGKDPSLFPPGHSVRVGLRRLAIAYLLDWAAGTDAEREEAKQRDESARAALSSVLEGRAPHGQTQLTRNDAASIPEPKGSLKFRLS